METGREYTGSRKIRKGSSKTHSHEGDTVQNSSKYSDKQSTVHNVRPSSATVPKKKLLIDTQKTSQVIHLESLPEIARELSLTSPRYSFSTEIPERYDETYIAVIAKDPNWLYVYWEFSDDTMKQIDTMLDQSGSKLVLRLKDTEVDDSIEKIIPFNIGVDNGQETHYLKVPEDGRDYQVECGFLSKQGDFLHIVQSNPVSVPALEPEQQFFDSPSNNNSNETLTNSISSNEYEKHIALNSYNSETCSALSSQYPGSAQEP